ncbi:MAG TPA: sulfite exporter TauE/SafE family protein [Ilumatobacter sp.]|nr:sulfite exporter TauE/SafE family protein [Ilumatobacter sp.]
MSPGDILLIAVAGFGAGAVNGMAGGGSLVSYPALLATGHGALVANVTNTVGILPGYAGGAAGFRSELRSQRARVREFAPLALLGGLAGAGLLLTTPEDVFDGVAPALIIAACLLFAFQPLLSKRIARRRAAAGPVDAADVHRPASWPVKAAVFVASVYGGYFGAGLGVIYLAVLGTVLPDPLPKINSLRGVMSLVVNALAVVLFGIAADVAWGAAGILAATSLVGGYIGARTALRLPAPMLRAVVLAFGVVAVWRLLAS